ncbi:MAG TPA: hypothetical protein PKM21_04000 [Anaerolineales bacterium]|nr:hypothetical protein [Anaerolineales bacterium]
MRKIIWLVLILLALMLACNMPGSTEEPAGGAGPASTQAVEAGGAPPPAGDSGAQPCPTAEPCPTLPPPTPTPIPDEPVSMRKGLASLNSYMLVVQTIAYGSDSPDQTLMRMETHYSQELDARMAHINMTIPQEGEEPVQSDSFTYTIGNDQCTGNDEDGWEFQTYTAQEKEMQDFLSQMMDLMPIIDDPVFVGAETMNGVAANHFTFQVSGVGGTSGVDVVTNQGEYWLAQDGQYLVRYTLAIETRDASTQETIHSEYLIDLASINQPVSIVFPAGCVP